MRRTDLAVCAALLVVVAWPAKAGFVDNFTGGSSPFTVGDPYWADTGGGCNGYIIQTTNAGSVCGGGFGTSITSDVTGSGYFLFDGTGTGSDYPPADGGGFYISPSFAVTADTEYFVSFYLTNANNIAPNAEVQPVIDGTTLGAAVTANGFFSDGSASDQWQLFSFSWNSGANTSATLTLNDLVLQAYGNDFGVDDISVQSNGTAQVPEPGVFSLICIGGLTLLGWSRRSRVR